MQLEQTGDLAQGSSRHNFIKKVYGHLFGAIVAFVGVLYLMFTTEFGISIINKMLTFNWGIILGGFILVGWLARMFASGGNKLSTQYFGLALYVVIESVIFAPLLATLLIQGEQGFAILAQAAGVTLAGFAVLTAFVFISKKDFSFLRSLLIWIGLMAAVAIFAAIIFGFNLGIGFSIAMIVLAGAAILYDTSNIRKHYPEDQYVGAAIDLFASVALMFWYVLRIFIGRD